MLLQQFGRGNLIDQKFLQNYMIKFLHYLNLNHLTFIKYGLDAQFVGHQIFFKKKIVSLKKENNNFLARLKKY